LRKTDPEDVLQSALCGFFKRFQEGQFEIANWESLWGILTLITMRKCHRRLEYFHAACRDCRQEEGLLASREAAIQWSPTALEPEPAEVAMVTELVGQLLEHFDPRDQAILELHLQGYTIPEISEKVGRAERTIHRTLHRARQRLRQLLEAPVE
jgi:RNA polymerase sigma-70 factor (ECF subfamily)